MIPYEVVKTALVITKTVILFAHAVAATFSVLLA